MDERPSRSGIPGGYWPENIPADLAWRLRDALSYRQCGPDDIWDEVRDWLTENRIKPLQVRPTTGVRSGGVHAGVEKLRPLWTGRP